MNPTKLVLLALAAGTATSLPALAQTTAGGPLDPATLPKYVTPLVIPPEMPASTRQPCAGISCPAAQYNIATRQFRQQVLPGGVWNTLNGRHDSYGPTTVWSYGREEDAVPAVAPAPASQTSFNFPALTVENRAGVATRVRWLNELVALDPATGKPYPAGSGQRNFLPSLAPVDPSLEWANPAQYPCLSSTGLALGAATTDCAPDPAQLPQDTPPGATYPVVQAYAGPVPNVVHVHGAEVGPDSDGFAEAWWLPAADNLPAGYASHGREYDQADRTNGLAGSALFAYPNTQPATTLWYHDHTLGITHSNVYAGLAGFWVIRPDAGAANALFSAGPPSCQLPGSQDAFGRPTNPLQRYDTVSGCGTRAVVTGQAAGCDPNFDLTCRAHIREIPLVIQDRQFNRDGSLFYSGTRNDATPASVEVPFAPASDIAPIINPEFFASALTVNGTTYPELQVVRERYRFRLLNGSDARSYNLALWRLTALQRAAAALLLAYADGKVGGALPNVAYTGGRYAGLRHTVQFSGGDELPFYQIGAEQGTLPHVVKIRTGSMLTLPGAAGGFSEPAMPRCRPGADPQDPNCERALVLTLAQRLDVIVDFSGLSEGDRVRMTNTAPDCPFEGFPLDFTTGPTPGATDQVMEFAVVRGLSNALHPQPVQVAADPSVPPRQLDLARVAEAPLTVPANPVTREVSLRELESERMCAALDPMGNVDAVSVFGTPQLDNFDQTCATVLPGGMPYGPRIDMVGTMSGLFPVPHHWADPIEATPTQGQVQVWEIWNFTPDGHPMHLHGTRFQILGRDALVADPVSGTAAIPAQLTGQSFAPLDNERGYTDTLYVPPLTRTRLAANFERPGLYQWHCHITEHEDNEMMVPICVLPAGSTGAGAQCVSGEPGPAAPPPYAIAPDAH